MSIIDKQFFSISSNAGDLQNGSWKSKVLFTFPNLVQRRDGLHLCRLGIDSVVIPISWYVVNQYNCRIHFLDEYDNPDTNQDLHIPEGNYSARELCAQLQSMYAFWSVTVSEFTGKITITPSHLIRIWPDSTCYGLLGLEEGVEYPIEAGFPLEAPYPCNVGSTKTIVVRSDIPCPNTDSATGTGFLLSIPVTEAFWGFQVYQNNNGDGCILPPDFSTDHINVEICDDDGRLLDFNGQDWKMTLFVEYTYAPIDHSSLSDVIRNYETEILLAIEQKKKKAKHHHHHYNLRGNSKHGKKTTTSG
jgi:hypothetical protein